MSTEANFISVLTAAAAINMVSSIFFQLPSNILLPFVPRSKLILACQSTTSWLKLRRWMDNTHLKTWCPISSLLCPLAAISACNVSSPFCRLWRCYASLFTSIDCFRFSPNTRRLRQEIGNVHRHLVDLSRVVHYNHQPRSIYHLPGGLDLHSISLKILTSSLVTKLIATPLRPKRPERPILWM